MAFTGKATYSAGANLPEIAEDVSELISIAAPNDTPLLDALGDPARPARSTVHEWLEDAPLPRTGIFTTFVDEGASMQVQDASVFRVGDMISIVGQPELMQVSSVDLSGSKLGLIREYGNTSGASSVNEGAVVSIVSNASLEGADATSARFTTRQRQANYTQIFAATVEVSGSELAVRQIAVRDELDYQKAMRTRELLGELENAVINGVEHHADPQGSGTVRRTMRGILASITTHRFKPGVDGFPSETVLSERQLNTALRSVWEGTGRSVDLIVVGGRQKRAINRFVASGRRFNPSSESYKDLISTYESDFGLCRVLLCRSVPPGKVLLLDSSRISVVPLAGRSFAYTPLARTGDREAGQVIGEYTLELRNQQAHAVIENLSESDDI